MNHLAHLYLSPPSMEARVGNLLGDFARGLDPQQLPAEVRRGLENHRAVDAFTDQHPDVLAAKRLFSSKRRRFAGVALDILFDHYLLRHWDAFANTPKAEFIDNAYRDLAQGRYLMPEAMARVTRRMIEDNWLESYEDLTNIGFALDRVAGRIRFANEFAGIIEEIRPLDAALEAHFLSFFPQLRLYFAPE
ncbi:MAG: ACP phosphodiesterase [Marinobacter sp.]|uniref:acyl carrier protein phosphodiesterase n=1 Tax=Marinobacter sp. TaxID=50741 RepID=UPI00299E99EC|nr:ACP phosphodiesterase [Marinobacter sp.]MDX1634109.1 ACP phosphodiesterase [Marinobacter sp.]